LCPDRWSDSSWRWRRKAAEGACERIEEDAVIVEAN